MSRCICGGETIEISHATVVRCLICVFLLIGLFCFVLFCLFQVLDSFKTSKNSRIKSLHRLLPLKNELDELQETLVMVSRQKTHMLFFVVRVLVRGDYDDVYVVVVVIRGRTAFAVCFSAGNYPSFIAGKTVAPPRTALHALLIPTHA